MQECVVPAAPGTDFLLPPLLPFIVQDPLGVLGTLSPPPRTRSRSQALWRGWMEVSGGLGRPQNLPWIAPGALQKLKLSPAQAPKGKLRPRELVTSGWPCPCLSLRGAPRGAS